MTGSAGAADVCVVGGGPAGFLLALTLARHGRRVVIVERGDGRDPRWARISPHLSPPTLAFLDALGLAEEIAPAGHPVLGITEVCADGSAHHTSIGRALSVPIARILAVAREALAHEPAAAVFSGTAVEAVQDNGVLLADGRTLSCPVVVSAEGPAARLRERAGFVTDRIRFARPLVMVHVEAEAPELIQAYHVDGGLLSLIPLAGNRVILQCTAAPGDTGEVRARAARILPMFVERFWPQLAGRVAAAVEDPGRVSVIRHEIVRPRKWSKEHVVLLGDSAHAVHAFGGQALNLAVQDVMALGHALVFGEAPFSAYERTRRPFVEAFQEYQAGLAPLTGDASEEPLMDPVYPPIAEFLENGQSTVTGLGLEVATSAAPGVA